MTHVEIGVCVFMHICKTVFDDKKSLGVSDCVCGKCRFARC